MTSSTLDDNRCRDESAYSDCGQSTLRKNARSPALLYPLQTMIQLHYSNRLENLIAPLAASVTEHQRRHPLAPLSILVPSPLVEQLVKNRPAESLRVAPNLKFPLLRSSLAEIPEAADP